MKPATTKPTRRRAMRAATVFTGAAAAAAFAPAAMAATAGPGHAAATGHLAQPEGRVTGSIRSAPNCSGAVSHWLHVTSAVNDFTNRYVCYGYRGRFTVGGEQMKSQCGGNNNGFLFSAGNVGLAFGPGTTFRHFKTNISLSSVVIDGWTGNDRCSHA
jgi:hypothetical protein